MGFLARYVRAVRHRGQLRLAKALMVAAKGRTMRVRADNGAMLSMDPADFISWIILVDGAWEPHTLTLASRLMESGGTFVDVGAAFGLFTCVLGRLPGVTCVAVEPSSEAFQRLRASMAMNPGVRAALFNVAVGPDHALEYLRFPSPLNQGQARIRANDVSPEGHFVAVVPLRDVLHRAGTKAVQLVKLDVEGMELEVLSRFDWQGPLRPRHLIVEVNEAGAASGRSDVEVLEFFSTKGYAARQVDGRPFTPGAAPLEDNLWLEDEHAR